MKDIHADLGLGKFPKLTSFILNPQQYLKC